MGRTLRANHVMNTAITGINATIISASFGLVMTRRTDAPIAQMGALVRMRRNIITIICVMWMSDVDRVIRFPVCSSSRFPNENDCTFRTSSERRS